jgi:nickel superoxide dismutase
MKPLSCAILLSLGMLLLTVEAQAHCQVPCGIYDDHARIHAMQEDASTIAKAVKKLNASADKTDAQSLNQRVRWTNTKEEHASRIIEVVSTYFLTQKLKPAKAKDKKAYKAYVERLIACHKVMKKAMKAKQTVDAGVVDKLVGAIKALGALYPKTQ